MSKKNWSLYLHIPFCRRKCHYCDFASYAGKEQVMPRYVAALIKEMRGKKELFAIDKEPVTIYIGGGTPTVLPLNLFKKITAALDEIFFDGKMKSAALEFTVEANPGTINEEYLRALKNFGINRLSIGAQSFNDRLLKCLGRIHSHDDIFHAVTAAKAAGFTNISVDVMYALPEETLNDLRRDLAAAIALNVPHISVYGLTIEDGTEFAARLATGNLPLPDDNLTDAMYEYLTAELPRRNFCRYEISNYAQPNYESRHNLGYWHFRPYLGIGAAAHSFWLGNAPVVGERFYNPATIDEYFHEIDTGNFSGVSEAVRNVAIAASEFCFLAMRSARGIDRARFAAHFGAPLEEFFGAQLDKLKRRGALAEQAGKIALTPLGMKYGNMVFAEFC